MFDIDERHREKDPAHTRTLRVRAPAMKSHAPISVNSRIVEVAGDPYAQRVTQKLAGRGIDQAAVALLGVMFALTGLQAAFFPKSFFDDYPGGRGWIALTPGAYNEHLVRDVGALFLALVIISLWAWWRPALCLTVAVGWLVVGVQHLVFHVTHLDNFDAADAFGMVSSL